jgi:signal transduction histidine kinase
MTEPAKEELLAGATELYALLMQVPAAITVFRGREYRCVFQNTEAKLLLDHQNRTMQEVWPENAPVQTALFDRVMDTGRVHVEREVATRQRWHDSATEERYWDVTYAPLRLADGTIDGVITIGFEVTDAVLARRQAAEAEAAREMALVDSERLAEEALAANRAKDEFLAMLGHELRNPLAPMMTAVELTKMRGEPMTKELETIERQVHHLSRLVDDLLDISRITSGRLELHRERVSLRTAIDRAIEIASPLLEQKRHRLSTLVERNSSVIGDPVRLAQVFSNLINNAARYTPPGGHIRVTVTREGDRAVIRIADNGIGISPELRDRIFTPFVQGARGVARSEGGLGLGLALVHTLVQLHGGQVTAHSAGTGRGSELVVELPVAPEDTMQRDQEAEADANDKRRVLVVDDNVDAAELISDLLRHLGHDVAVAHDGAEALRVAERFHPEVAVLDIGLPVMDGYELARRLAQREEHVRLIALTGYGQASDKARSRDAGFAVHMIKPVDMRALARALVA